MLLDSDLGSRPADNGFWAAKCQLLLVRPAIEPIACSCWKRFGTFDLDKQVALVIASTLAGRPLVYRKGPAKGRSAHGDVTFEPLEIASQWLAKIATASRRPELRAALPIYAFAQAIMAHPFSDGNGRFARLMVHAALAKCAGLRRPEIALAPAFYRRAAALGGAITALSESGDWPPFNAVFLSILEDALAHTKAFHRQRRGRI
jgi:Fic/DOC family protein